MKNLPRETALAALLEIRRCRVPFKKAIEDRDPGMDSRDRSLCLELVAGVLRHRGQLDSAISEFLRRPLASVQPLIQEVLRLGTYQLLFTEKIPVHAAIHETVNLVRAEPTRTLRGFVNAVLRKISQNSEVLRNWDTDGIPSRRLPDVLSHPSWLVTRWIERFGVQEAVRLCEANNLVPPLSLRVRTRRISVEDFIQELAASGLKATRSPLLPNALRLSTESSLYDIPAHLWIGFQVQDEAAQMITSLLSPQPGERILDACAAPGGKTGHLADLLTDQGELVALDKDPKRLQRLAETVTRLELRSVRTLAGDLLDVQNLGIFDRILLDAPCSGLGVVRRNPDIKWCRRPADLSRNQDIQRRMIDRAKNLLKPGGRLVYAVCSFEPEETVEVVKHLEEDISFRTLNVSREPSETPFFYCFPHREGTDGFFAAAFENTEGVRTS